MYSQKIKQYLRHVHLGGSTRPKGHFQTLALKDDFYGRLPSIKISRKLIFCSKFNADQDKKIKKKSSVFVSEKFLLKETHLACFQDKFAYFFKT